MPPRNTPPSAAGLPVDEGAEIASVFGALPTLETERLVLRRMRADDAEDVFTYERFDDMKLYAVLRREYEGARRGPSRTGAPRGEGP